jgi:hypothetical protein
MHRRLDSSCVTREAFAVRDGKVMKVVVGLTRP